MVFLLMGDLDRDGARLAVLSVLRFTGGCLRWGDAFRGTGAFIWLCIPADVFSLASCSPILANSGNVATERGNTDFGFGMFHVLFYLITVVLHCTIGIFLAHAIEIRFFLVGISCWHLGSRRIRLV